LAQAFLPLAVSVFQQVVQTLSSSPPMLKTPAVALLKSCLPWEIVVVVIALRESLVSTKLERKENCCLSLFQEEPRKRFSNETSVVVVTSLIQMPIFPLLFGVCVSFLRHFGVRHVVFVVLGASLEIRSLSKLRCSRARPNLNFLRSVSILHLRLLEVQSGYEFLRINQ